ncbi:hypothetical protein GNF72_16465, partial [Clostridium perfringens]|uniref:hypothetical protein n=1 Tax=Clostridium perfringens TaxID=1502 RepID=UPI002AC3DF7B
PESFKVLIKELQALCLDVKVLNDENQEVRLKEFAEEDMEDLEVNIEGTEDVVSDDINVDDSYTISEEEVEEDVEFDNFALDGFQEEDLELDDFVNDEH